MKLIRESEQPGDCSHCRHYAFRPEERFPHGCLAMKYVGKEPASETVLKAEDGPCPLFEAPARPEP
jgi:hypothetical protein